MADADTAAVFYRQNLQESLSMARYALTSGKVVSGNLLEDLYTMADEKERTQEQYADAMRQLGGIHAKLSRLIAPATPRTILLLEREEAKNGLFHFLGPVPLIRQMMLVSILLLVAFILITLSPNVNGVDANSNILKGSGAVLLLNELFLLCAAGVGATFYTLFQANRYIQEGTFDPKYNSSYWIRILLGMIAGFILATVIDQQMVDTDGNSVTGAFGRPLLAMIGGFSASLVYRILSRIADTVEALFRGDMREQQSMNMEALRTKLSAEGSQERTRVAYGLMKLQKLTASGADAASLQKELDKTLEELLASDGTVTTDQKVLPVQQPSNETAAETPTQKSDERG